MSASFLDPLAVGRCMAMFQDVRHVEMTNAEYHSQSYLSISKTRLTYFQNDPQAFYQRWDRSSVGRYRRAGEPL
jgi:hypothetical protein